jgi:hypothetical protein
LFLITLQHVEQRLHVSWNRCDAFERFTAHGMLERKARSMKRLPMETSERLDQLRGRALRQ